MDDFILEHDLSLCVCLKNPENYVAKLCAFWHFDVSCIVLLLYAENICLCEII